MKKSSLKEEVGEIVYYREFFASSYSLLFSGITCLRLKLMAGHKIAHATLKGPSVIKEICIGITLGLIAGGMWKMHHWNEQRKVRAFYDMLEKGEISVVAEE
ncbi:hypothetical protein HHK36_026407 [Tetracentron sinense]|uniref:Cytochrome c oxidase subunit 5C n=1 Tax=Tetracentron sinense TaxID=13715 RepID=A0A835D4K4_TETSI|nr:hypothetical protein HHK36_026407 [Tetracentron sinense]